jgi:hypothetical protein
MKIFKTLSVSFLLAGALVSTSVVGKVNSVVVNYSETPAKTAVIKHPAASNINKYFSEATLFHFEVYKIGSQQDINMVITAFTKDSNVESCTAGVVTGDYQAFDVSVKSAKDKAWFVAKLKKAGVNTIKINNNPVVDIERL